MILHPLQFDDLLGAIPHPAAVLEPGGRVIRVNEGWRAFWARSSGDADLVGLGVNFLDVCAATGGEGASAAARIAAGVRAVAAGELAATGEELDWDLPDAPRPVRVSVTPVGSEHRTVLVSIVDLSLQTAVAVAGPPERATTALGRTLPDRRSFVELAEHSAALAARHGFSVGVVALAADGLDEITVHDGARFAGDVRRIVVARLLAALRPADVVADVGRETFLVLLPDTAQAGAATEVAARLVDDLARPIRVGERSAELRPRAGVALLPVGGNGEAAVEQAEDAREQARLGANPSVAVAGADGWTATARPAAVGAPIDLSGPVLDLDLDLDAEPLLDEHLLAYFQPIVDLTDRGIVGVEALLRWRHPHYGVLSAGEFLGLELNRAHRTTLAEQALVAAVEAWADVRDGLVGPTPHLFLNLTPDQLRNRHSLDRLGHLLVATGVPADDVVVEITEAAMDAPFGELIDALGDLRQLGVRLALDDFGAGYSSLGRLRHLPVDVVKVDRQMTQGVDTDRRARRMLASVLQMATELGLECIVEGCETESEAAALASLGVRFVQGFALGLPMPAADLAARVGARPLAAAH